jgi:hypothetical protein
MLSKGGVCLPSIYGVLALFMLNRPADFVKLISHSIYSHFVA